MGTPTVRVSWGCYRILAVVICELGLPCFYGREDNCPFNSISRTVGCIRLKSRFSNPCWNHWGS